MNTKSNDQNTKGRKGFAAKLAILSFAVFVFTASAFAGPEEVSSAAVDNLKSKFGSLQNVEWKVSPLFTKAAFTWKSQQFEVFFDDKGEITNISRHISKDILPVPALMHIEDKYKGYEVAETIEIRNQEEGIAYYASLKKDAKKVILKISIEGVVSVFSK